MLLLMILFATLTALHSYEDRALVFCCSGGWAERPAKLIVDELQLPAARLPEPPEEENDPVLGLLPRGVAYHYVGLITSVRQLVKGLFHAGLLRVVAFTPKLAAGVSLLPDVAIVRNVFCMKRDRGRYRPVPLPTGEILNIIGRAGSRPQRLAASAALIRGRTVEDGLRWVHALNSGQDCSRVGTTIASWVMATLRNLTITILRLYISIATALRPATGPSATNDDHEILSAQLADALFLSLRPYCSPVLFRFRKPRHPVGRGLCSSGNSLGVFGGGLAYARLK